MTEQTTGSELSESENIAKQTMWTQIEANEMENQRLHLAKRTNIIVTIAAVAATIAAIATIVTMVLAVNTNQALEIVIKNTQQQINATQLSKKTDGK